jgi:hypothetical protein
VTLGADGRTAHRWTLTGSATPDWLRDPLSAQLSARAAMTLTLMSKMAMKVW